MQTVIDGVVAAAQVDLVRLYLREGHKLHLRGFGPSGSSYIHDDTVDHENGDCLCGLAVSNANWVVAKR